VTATQPRHHNALHGPLPDPTHEAGYPEEHPPRVGFFTDTSICIGCKACEVACKEWNTLPMDGVDGGPLVLSGMSFDNTGALTADTWRHVAFIEQSRPVVDLPMPSVGPPPADDVARVGPTVPAAAEPVEQGTPQQTATSGGEEIRWLMSSDVCKHCTHAGCLDACPTGALVRTEFGTVVVQADICNGCGYCIPACPFGVLGQREGDGRAFKCTLCYDRLTDGRAPACASACPTQSIQFGELDELRERADQRVAALHENGVESAQLYLESEDDGVGGGGAFFLLLDEPEVYGLPPDPVVTTRDLPSMWRSAAAGALTLVAVAASSFLGRRR
jgi:formate dehydrogenase iron-sulfur subunit